MAKKTTAHPEEDDLAQIIHDALNKMNKEKQVSHFLTDDAYDDFTEFVSTGDSMLDLAISNRPHGGIAVGRITEFQGLEASGKSLICMHLIKNVQDRDGIAIYVDTENAINQDFARAIGVRTVGRNSLQVVTENTIEKIFEYCEKVITMTRENPKYKDKLLLIIIDSIAGASTIQEMEADYNKDGYATGKAIILGKAFRKITNLIGSQRVAFVVTNQLRMKMNAPTWGDQYTTPGGKAIGYSASTRVRLSLIGDIKTTNKDTIGVKVKAEVVKNRLGPPKRKVDFEIYFDRGIDDHKSWLNVMEAHKLISKNGAWYSYTDEAGEKHKFQAKDFPAFLSEDLERKEKIYMDICDAYVMSYNSRDLDPEDIIIEEVTSDD